MVTLKALISFISTVAHGCEMTSYTTLDLAFQYSVKIAIWVFEFW